MRQLRAAATWLLDQRTVPRHQSVKLFSQGFHNYLGQLIPRIGQLAEVLPPDDVPRVALAGVGEARRRLEEPESVGLHGEVDRVRRLARSIVAPCDHFDTLTGLVMCLACDKPIEAGDAWVPYDQVSPSGGVARAGRIHCRCANAPRRH
ncbi:DUF6415 family natural product biosynthesis protein [Streptomyces sp. NPDC059866]|uniref:DUF6415 family natural product biosynthesis protein n=1 Tax=Streptomyces sp. NPDC059866 TaxID=3346978 RepID=UPI003661D5B2